MMIVALFSWWYGAGWQRLARQSEERVQSMLETFSVGLLFSTLFAPFHQISAGAVRGPASIQVRAWADRAFSRLFGAVVRSFTILIGLFAAFFAAIFGLTMLVLWLVVPLLPAVGLVLFLIGWKL